MTITMMMIIMIMIKMTITRLPPAPLTTTSTIHKHCAHPLNALFFTLNNNPMRQIHYSYFMNMEVEG